MRRQFLKSAMAAAALAAAGAAKSPVTPVNKNKQGLALHGYDPVAYFVLGKPVEGKQEFVHVWMEAEWRFSNASDRDTFAENPSMYAPRFGGYCAWAVSNGYIADIDPEAWKIVEGKLYLNYSKRVQKKWEQDLSQRIQTAEQNWPALHR